MKNLLSLLFLTVSLLLPTLSSAQTLIGTSTHIEATANHNQRKIVRDLINNIYVVWVDSLNQELTIFGQKFTNSGNVFMLSGSWGTAAPIVVGHNPTLAISGDNKINLIYETNDTLSQIKHRSTIDFTTWSMDLTISDTTKKHSMPVADIDSIGKLNVFWVQQEMNSESAIYACMQHDTLISTSIVMTKSSIEDISIANHLQYFKNDLFVGIQFNQDSLIFYRSTDNMMSYDTLYEARGSQPCISYNSYSPNSNYSEFMFLYIDLNDELIEVEMAFNVHSKQVGTVSHICINNVIPGIGYSFLYQKNNTLYHAFSFGNGNAPYILDSITTNPINASIAYKHYNAAFVDFIWMESTGSGYNIFHKRDAKYVYVSTEEIEDVSTVSMRGYPNPFREKLNIELSMGDKNYDKEPSLKIYSTNSKLIHDLKPISKEGNLCRFEWFGNDLAGATVPDGIYILQGMVGEQRVVKKVIYRK